MPTEVYEVRLFQKKDTRRFQKFRDLCSKNGARALHAFGTAEVRELDLFYPNLLLLRKGRIVASLRLEYLTSWKDFDLRYRHRGKLAGKVKFPCVFTTQAYTRPDWRGHGYNTFLRRLAIELARQWKARSVLNDMIADSPRRQTMLKMGYKAYPHPTGWVDMKVKDKISSMLLDLEKNSQKALKVSGELTKDLRRQAKVSKEIWKIKIPNARLDLLIYYESLR